MAYAEVVVSSSQATSQSLPISVLDLIFSRAGEPASSAIAQSVELARQVEQLGYKRHWVAVRTALAPLFEVFRRIRIPPLRHAVWVAKKFDRIPLKIA